MDGNADPVKLTATQQRAWTMATDLAAAKYRLSEARRMFIDARDALRATDERLNDIDVLLDSIPGFTFEEDADIEQKIQIVIDIIKKKQEEKK